MMNCVCFKCVIGMFQHNNGNKIILFTLLASTIQIMSATGDLDACENLKGVYVVSDNSSLEFSQSTNRDGDSQVKRCRMRIYPQRYDSALVVEGWAQAGVIVNITGFEPHDDREEVLKYENIEVEPKFIKLTKVPKQYYFPHMALWVDLTIPPADQLEDGLSFVLVISLDIVPSCEDNATVEASNFMQYIVSPGFPLAYPANTYCRWTIVSQHSLLLEIVNMDISDQYGGICSLNFVSIMKVGNTLNPEVFHSCGRLRSNLFVVLKHKQKEFDQPCCDVSVAFSTDGVNKLSRKGFFLRYRYLNKQNKDGNGSNTLGMVVGCTLASALITVFIATIICSCYKKRRFLQEQERRQQLRLQIQELHADERNNQRRLQNLIQGVHANERSNHREPESPIALNIYGPPPPYPGPPDHSTDQDIKNGQDTSLSSQFGSYAATNSSPTPEEPPPAYDPSMPRSSYTVDGITDDITETTQASEDDRYNSYTNFLTSS